MLMGHPPAHLQNIQMAYGGVRSNKDYSILGLYWGRCILGNYHIPPGFPGTLMSRSFWRRKLATAMMIPEEETGNISN